MGEEAAHALTGQVGTVEQLGDTSVAYISLPGLAEPVAVKLQAGGGLPSRGAAVRLAAEPAHLLAFAADDQRLDSCQFEKPKPNETANQGLPSFT